MLNSIQLVTREAIHAVNDNGIAVANECKGPTNPARLVSLPDFFAPMTRSQCAYSIFRSKFCLKFDRLFRLNAIETKEISNNSLQLCF